MLKIEKIQIKTPITIKTLAGEKGKDGNDYVITEKDYEEIAKRINSNLGFPTKVSELENDKNYIDVSYHDDTKQDKITTENKLDYNLLSNTPEIPNISDISSKIDELYEDYLNASKVVG